jgi:hypothetical protein
MPDAIDFKKLELMIKKNEICCPGLLRIAWLMSSVAAKDDLKQISNRLKMSNNEKKHLISSAEIDSCLNKIALDLSMGGIDIVLKSVPYDTVLLLSLMADDDTKKIIHQYLSIASKFKLLVNGDDLIKEGIHPGRIMHRLMNAIRYAQFNNSIADYYQAIELIKKLSHN